MYSVGMSTDFIASSPPIAPLSVAEQPSRDDTHTICTRFHHAVELIGRRWSGAIVHVLLQRPARFSVISATLPEMTDRMLSERLRELEEAGIVVRTVVPSTPVRVEYALTAQGRDLKPALDELAAWAHRWPLRSADEVPQT